MYSKANNHGALSYDQSIFDVGMVKGMVLSANNLGTDKTPHENIIGTRPKGLESKNL